MQACGAMRLALQGTVMVLREAATPPGPTAVEIEARAVAAAASKPVATATPPALATMGTTVKQPVAPTVAALAAVTMSEPLAVSSSGSTVVLLPLTTALDQAGQPELKTVRAIAGVKKRRRKKRRGKKKTVLEACGWIMMNWT